jgi:stage V sporulation protein AD
VGKRLGIQTVEFGNPVSVIGYYSVVGEKEGNGNFGKYFDYVLKDDSFVEKTYEKAERKLLEYFAKS